MLQVVSALDLISMELQDKVMSPAGESRQFWNISSLTWENMGYIYILWICMYIYILWICIYIYNGYH